jgi:hypothetical protein
MKYLILVFLLSGCHLELKYCSSWTECKTIFDIGDKGDFPEWDKLQ